MGHAVSLAFGGMSQSSWHFYLISSTRQRADFSDKVRRIYFVSTSTSYWLACLFILELLQTMQHQQRLASGSRIVINNLFIANIRLSCARHLRCLCTQYIMVLALLLESGCFGQIIRSGVRSPLFAFFGPDLVICLIWLQMLSSLHGTHAPWICINYESAADCGVLVVSLYGQSWICCISCVLVLVNHER